MPGVEGVFGVQGIAFVSETDTEVVAQLLDYYYEGDLLDAVGKVLHRIEGAYALGIVCADEPDRLVAVRKDSALILGYGANFHMLASDVTAVIQHTRRVCYLEDGGSGRCLPPMGPSVQLPCSSGGEGEIPCRLGDLCRGKGGL